MYILRNYDLLEIMIYCTWVVHKNHGQVKRYLECQSWESYDEITLGILISNQTVIKIAICYVCVELKLIMSF